MSKIGVIGMSGRFGGHCNNPQEYWDFLMAGKSAIIKVNSDRFNVHNFEERYKKSYYTTRVDNIEQFNYIHFNLPDKMAGIIDPQHRAVLHSISDALIDANIDITGSDAGVYIGVMNAEYHNYLRDKGIETSPYSATGNKHNMLGTLIKRHWNISSTPIICDQYCISSQNAMRHAMDDLLKGSCKVAVVSGVNLCLTERCFQKSDRVCLLNGDGKTRAYCGGKDGYCRGEAVCTIILTVEDILEDSVYCYINSCVLYTNMKNGDSVVAKRNMMDVVRTLSQSVIQSGIEPKDISYVELCGIGTEISDSIEANSLMSVYDSVDSVVLGSSTPAIGETESAMGLVMLIKLIFVLQNRIVPPNLCFDEEKSIWKEKFLYKSGIIKLDEDKKMIGAMNGEAGSGGYAHTIITCGQKKYVVRQ